MSDYIYIYLNIYIYIIWQSNTYIYIYVHLYLIHHPWLHSYSLISVTLFIILAVMFIYFYMVHHGTSPCHVEAILAATGSLGGPGTM